MSLKPIDSFILNSVDLFKVNPSQSVISITYQPPKQNDSNTDNDDKKNINLGKVTFKTNNPHLASNYKYSTNKNKDVSRLLNAVGPRGVSIIPAGILKKRINGKINKDKSLSKKEKSKLIRDSNHQITGLGSLLVNDIVPEFNPQEELAKQSNTTTASSSSRSNKKKNKNKNKRKH